MSRPANGAPVGMSAPREYFPGCIDQPLFDLLAEVPHMVGPLSPTPNVSMADVVRAAESRPADDGTQLSLPAEFMPVPAGRLFA